MSTALYCTYQPYVSLCSLSRYLFLSATILKQTDLSSAIGKISMCVIIVYFKVSKNEREEEKEPRQIIQDNTSYLINTGYIDFNFLIYF